MNVAPILRELMAAGITGDALVMAIERIEAAMVPVRSAAAERQARYRERERNKALRNVTSDVQERSPTPPKEILPTLSSSDSTSLESRSLGVTRARSTPRANLTAPWPRNFREQFWDAYPKKVGKKGALRVLERVFARAEVEFDRLLEAVRAYAATADPEFTKDPQTWLNKGCWDDEPPPKRRASKGFLELSLDIERQGHEREDDPDYQAQSYIATGH